MTSSTFTPMMMLMILISHSSALADKCSTRPVHDLDEVKKLQLRAEFLDYRDPVRPTHPHQEVEGEGVGDKEE